MKLLIRADASAEIGLGHVMRCLALAQAWHEEGGHVAFLMADSAPALETRLRTEGFEVIHHPHPWGDETDSQHTISLAQSLDAERVVVDGYHFGAAYQRHLKSAGLSVLFVDDNGHADYYDADWVLNQNVYAHEALYPRRASGTQILLGSRYALLRREFWPWQGWQRQIPPLARQVLVTLGGSDPDNVTLLVMQALQQLKLSDLAVIVVVGGSNPHVQVLKDVAHSGLGKFELRQDVTDMPELMAWADVAIAGGGSTCWELAFMGVPSLILTLADNQQAIADKLHDLKIVQNLGWFTDLTSEQLTTIAEKFLNDYVTRQRMKQLGQTLVDGQGSKRVAKILYKHRIAA